MKHRHDSFDLQGLRVDPTDGELVRLAKVPAKVQKRRGHFIKVPWGWFERLAEPRRRSTYRVALYLLYQHWKTHGDVVRLPNRGLGISSRSKWNALSELEQLGLITIERCSRKSPRIIVMVDPHKS